jgi:hypothetical protein
MNRFTVNTSPLEGLWNLSFDLNLKVMKHLLLFSLLASLVLISFGQDNRTLYFPKTEVEVPATQVPQKKNLWVFVLAGQSNMAGRGQVEPQDTVPDKRILTINLKGQLVLAKEPLHLQEPGNAGLDCGLSFARTMIKNLPPNISVLIIPTAIGGSSISKWIGDSLYRRVHLLTNFREKMAVGTKYGVVKAVLWHQGEADATPQKIPLYKERLKELFTDFRSAARNASLPVLMGELGPFQYNLEGFIKINAVLREYASTDEYSAVIPTGDLKDKGDSLHFNSESQRIMGQRFAEEYLRKFKGN